MQSKTPSLVAIPIIPGLYTIATTVFSDSSDMETPWSAHAIPAIAEIENFYPSDRVFQRACANYIDRIAEFWFLQRSFVSFFPR